MAGRESTDELLLLLEHRMTALQLAVAESESRTDALKAELAAVTQARTAVAHSQLLAPSNPTSVTAASLSSFTGRGERREAKATLSPSQMNSGPCSAADASPQKRSVPTTIARDRGACETSSSFSSSDAGEPDADDEDSSQSEEVPPLVHEAPSKDTAASHQHVDPATSTSGASDGDDDDAVAAAFHAEALYASAMTKQLLSVLSKLQGDSEHSAPSGGGAAVAPVAGEGGGMDDVDGEYEDDVLAVRNLPA